MSQHSGSSRGGRRGEYVPSRGYRGGRGDRGVGGSREDAGGRGGEPGGSNDGVEDGDVAAMRAEIYRLRYEADVTRAAMEMVGGYNWAPSDPIVTRPFARPPPPLAHPYGYGTAPTPAPRHEQHQQYHEHQQRQRQEQHRQHQQHQDRTRPASRPSHQQSHIPLPPQQEPQQQRAKQEADQDPEGVRDVVCGNCKQAGHDLRTCMGPLKNGYLRGCPIHNTAHHNLQKCHHFSRLSHSTILHHIIYSRNNRPPLEYSEEYSTIRGFATGEQKLRPWTIAFSLDNSEAWRTHNYRRRPRDETTIRDPAWDSPAPIPPQRALLYSHPANRTIGSQRERTRSRSPTRAPMNDLRQRSPNRARVEDFPERSPSQIHRGENIGAAEDEAAVEVPEEVARDGKDVDDDKSDWSYDSNVRYEAAGLD